MSTTRALRLAEWVLQHEGDSGVITNDPADRGGVTRYGITEAVAMRHGLDVRRITREQALEIYVKDYWSFDWCRSDRLAAKLFDIAVNMGPRTAAVLLQRALILLGEDLTEDGNVGPLTQRSVTRTSTPKLLATLAFQQMKRYELLVQRRPSQQRFIGGWMVRAMDEYDPYEAAAS